MATMPKPTATATDGLCLEEGRATAVGIAQAAGDLVRRRALAGTVTSWAKSENDLSTPLDQEADALIVERLHRAFPSHAVLAEETGSHFDQSAPWRWLVDPLDGSNNIAVGLPIVAIGLALCHRDRAELGVVHEPLAGRTLSAVRGERTRDERNRPVQARNRTGQPTLIAWTQGYGVRRDDRTAARLRDGLHGYAKRVLELWAPLTAWAMLARGDIDGIVGYRIGELDLHSGALVAQMAGAGIEIRGFDRSPFALDFGGLEESRCIVAAVPRVREELLDLVAGAIAP